MTSSGTYSWTLSISEGVLASYERIQIRSPSIRQEHMVTARREVNLLFVELANRQVNLWKVELASIPMVSGTATYSIPARTVMILDAYIALNNATTFETDRYVTPLSRTEYASIATKQSPGPPTQFWFDRLISPTIAMWPVPDSSGPYTLNYYFCSQMQDANVAGGETPDLPYRWLDVLVSGLAHRLSRTYAPTLEAIREKDYNRAWEIAATQDTENVATSFAPAIGGYYRR
jgi:hypothetical protein